MRITALLLASSLLFTACSVEVSTDLVPTTAAPEGRVDVEGGVEIPRDTADAAVGALLLEWNAILPEFVELYEQPEIVTVGDMVTWGYAQEPVMNAMLDRMEANLNAIASYIGEESLSASARDVSGFVALGRTFVAGHRVQADPEFSCLSMIPESAYSESAEYLFTLQAYTECFTAAIGSSVVEETVAAAAGLAAAYSKVYDAILEG
jgi:hypothetical protein